MIPLKRYFSLDGMYIFVLFLFAAQATVWTSNFTFPGSIVQFLLVFMTMIFMVRKHSVNLQNHWLCLIVAVLAIWFVLQVVVRGLPFEITALFNLVFFVILVFVTVKSFKEDILLWVEDVITKMTFLSLVLYVLMSFVGPDTMAHFCFMEPASTTSKASMLVFNVPNSRYDGLGLLGLARNCGYCWEPGLFSCFICVGVTLNLLRTNCKILNNKSLYILLVALFTTFSTTGYFTFLIILISFYLRNTGVVMRTILVVITIPILLYILDLPFMGEKIMASSDEDLFITNDIGALKYYENRGGYWTPQRFECIALDWMNFQDSPILGYGTNPAYSYVRRNISDYIALSNGVVKDFAMFGIFLALLFNLLIVRNSVKIAEIYRNKNVFAIMVLYYSISVSYSFIFSALLSPVFLYSYFSKDNRKIDFAAKNLN